MNSFILYKYLIRFIFIVILIYSKLSFGNQLPPVVFGIELASSLSNYTNVIDSRNGGEYAFTPKKPDPYINHYYFDAHKFSEKIYSITAIKRKIDIDTCLAEKQKWSSSIKSKYGKPIKTVHENAPNGKLLTLNGIERLQYKNFTFDIRCSGYIFYFNTRASGKLYLEMLDENDKLNNPKAEYLD